MVGGGNAGAARYATVIYDHATARWFISALNNAIFATRNILIAVSNSSDPTEGWKGFIVDPDPADLTIETFPKFGLNADGLYWQARMIDNRGDGIVPDPPPGTTIVSLPKADLLSATPTLTNATIFLNLDGTNPLNPTDRMQPVVDFGPSNGSEPLLGSQGPLTRVNVENAAGPGSATLTPLEILDAPYSDFGGVPPNAPQPGTTTLIEASSPLHLSSVVKQGNSLWVVRGEDVDGRAGIRWFEIDEPTNEILQTGTIGHPDLFLYNASISANESGDVVIGFSGSSATQYPGAYAVAGRTVNGVTSFGGIRLLQAGRTNVEFETVNPFHWGRYSVTVRDPDNSKVFWTFQEFMDSDVPFGNTGNIGDQNWGVQIAEIDLTGETGDNQPPDVNNQSFSIPIGSANGSTVGTIASSDPDPSETLTFAVFGGTGAMAFEVDNYTGEITVADATELDLQTPSSFTLDVQLTDAGGFTDTAVITIDLSYPLPKLEISGSYTIGGQPTNVVRSGNALSFINERGEVSRGRYLTRTEVVAIDWNSLTGQLIDGRIEWANGSTWSDGIVGTYTIDSRFTTVEQTGEQLTFTNERGEVSTGHFVTSTEVLAEDWGDLPGTFVDGRIEWDNGTVWEAPDVPDVSGDYFIADRPTGISRSGNELLFTNERGEISRGYYLNDKEVRALDWGGLVGEIAKGVIRWGNGSVWVDDINGEYTFNGETAGIAQSGNLLTFTNEHGSVSQGRFLNETHVVANDWGGLIGQIVNGRLEWRNGSIWQPKAGYASADAIDRLFASVADDWLLLLQ